MDFFSKDKLTAYEAKEAAQWIAFGPVIFQAARVLKNSGILAIIDASGKEGLEIAEIAGKANLPEYGVRVLLESALGTGIVLLNNKKFTLGKTGFFILHDPLTKTNMDFVHDVNYKALFHLDESIETGKPVGLKEFGDWRTVYEGLSEMPDNVKKSWFAFDHFFSDDAFPKVLPMVYSNGIKKLLDVGGNTGKWAIASVNYAPEIHVTIVDLPGQLNVAKANIKEAGLQDRVGFLEANILTESHRFPQGFDAIWFSQCLDCFSEQEIISILKKCYVALDNDGEVIIMEPFWDKQKFEVAAFCLQQTSLYFSTVANGNSQMYSAETFFRCIEKAGFKIVEEINQIGLSQTLLKCKKIV